MAAGQIIPVLFADVFTDAPGTLVVNKTISGAGAGQQGPIAILVDCGQPLNQYAFIIPANTPAGTRVTKLPEHSGRLDVHRHRDIQRRQPAQWR